MRILIIDNNIDHDAWGSPDLRSLARLAHDATFLVRRAPHGDLPTSPSGFDRIIVSGSKTSALADASWISLLHAFIRKTLDLGIPYLGICYGHQSLVRAIGGKAMLRNAKTPEFGWTKIDRTSDSRNSRIFEGLPGSFHSFSSHFQEAWELPPGFRVLARSEFCEVQAVELVDRPVFGVQFHPEKDLRGGEQSLASRKKSGKPKFLINEDQGSKLYDPNVGETIFRNFLKCPR